MISAGLAPMSDAVDPLAVPLADLPALLPALSLRVVTVHEPLVLGASAQTDLALFRTLRDATSYAVRLQWTLTVLGSVNFPLYTHAHLVPPTNGADSASERYAAEWRADYRYGSFYYREGPGFVAVKDVRPGIAASRMIIEEGAAEFLGLAEEGIVAPGHKGSLVTDAEEAGLLIQADNAVLVLPYRMRHWPVPYVAI